jgi:twitching motility protein PilI
MTTAPQEPGARKSSLREFQQRLANRLTQVKSSQIATHLAVEVGRYKLLLPLAEAGEITSDIAVQALPHAKPWFLGVGVLRGKIVGVADMAVLLGERNVGSSIGTFIGTAEGLEVNCLLRVDKLAGLRTLDQYRPDKNARGDIGLRFVDDKNIVWEELSLIALAQDEQFLQVFN